MSTENLDEIVAVHNDISNVTSQMTLREAKALVEHPHFGEHQKIVRSHKARVDLGGNGTFGDEVAALGDANDASLIDTNEVETAEVDAAPKKRN